MKPEASPGQKHSVVEAENKTRIIKAAVQPAGGILHHRTFMSMHGGIPSTKTAGLSRSFQAEMNNSMVAETMGDYAFDSA